MAEPFAGADTELQFNAGGTKFCGAAGVLYDKSGQRVTFKARASHSGALVTWKNNAGTRTFFEVDGTTPAVRMGCDAADRVAWQLSPYTYTYGGGFALYTYDINGGQHLAYLVSTFGAGQIHHLWNVGSSSAAEVRMSAGTTYSVTGSGGSDRVLGVDHNGAIGAARVGSATSIVAFFGAAGATQSTGWSVSNQDTSVKSLDAAVDWADPQKVCDALCNVIARLKALGLVGA